MACKKDDKVLISVTTINVVNAAIDVASVKVNTSENPVAYSKTTDVVNFGANRFYYAARGLNTINAVATADTTKMLFNKKTDLGIGFYTLYLAGQAPNVDTLFRREDNFPFIKTDVTVPAIENHVTSVRFVNLSPNSPALKINIKNSVINEIENFTYKSIGNWKGYGNSAAGTTNYIFKVRNAATNAILLTYTFGATTTNRFKNVALVIKGLIGGTGANAFGIFPVNYF